jgi:dolichyl-phosphate-mannose--protein O-mannosyl transferase
MATFGYFDATKYPKEMIRANKIAPEYRLYSATFGSLLVPIGLFVSASNKEL